MGSAEKYDEQWRIEDNGQDLSIRGVIVPTALYVYGERHGYEKC